MQALFAIRVGIDAIAEYKGSMINRRTMLTRIAGACAVSFAVSRLLFSETAQPISSPEQPLQRIPRYRGFNLQWERQPGANKPAFAESDLAMMREWNFNFARIPLSYWIWSKPGDWMSIDAKSPLPEIDRLIDLGKQYRHPYQSQSPPYSWLLHQ